MKKLILLIAIICLGQLATAQNGIGYSREASINDIKNNPDFYNIFIYKDSIVYTIPAQKGHKDDIVTKYFKNDICYKAIILSDLRVFKTDSTDCSQVFTFVGKNIWTYEKDNGYNNIITFTKNKNNYKYTITGYTGYKEYIKDLLYLIILG